MSRAQIIAFAKTLIDSHYLWGSGGDMPDYDNGVYYAQNTVTMAPSSIDDDYGPVVFAAWLTVGQSKKYGVYVCAGRCKRLGDRTASVVDPEYTKYMQYLRDTDEPNWKPYDGNLSPRLIMGANVGANYGRAVWGEDCRTKRHFDCDSYVNYVLSNKTKKLWGFTTPQYLTLDRPDFWTEVATTAAPADGDILVRSGHVALLGADNHVYQAQQHDTGVHADETYSAGSWTRRLHPLDSVIP